PQRRSTLFPYTTLFRSLVGRASGIDADVRRDAPFAGYDEAEVHVPVYETGDVWARTMVRLDEVREAARLIRATAEPRDDGLTRRSEEHTSELQSRFDLV